MNQARPHTRQRRTMLVLTIILAWLFVHTLPLHAHNPHAHQPSAADHNSTSADQLHHTEIHLSTTDLDDNDHTTTAKIDLSKPTVVKSLKFGDTLAIGLIFIIILLGALFISNTSWPRNFTLPFNTRDLDLRPPLRAPPL